jgi:hypothetical protein
MDLISATGRLRAQELAAFAYAFDKKRKVDIFVAPRQSIAHIYRQTPRGLW